MTIAKRSFLVLLSSIIIFLSVSSSYYETVDAAEWVAGAVAAVGGGPILTALVIGGVVVAGGVAIYELSQTTPEDHRNFVNGIKTGFNQFVAEQEAIIAKENDQTLTDQEAADIGVANARETVNNFASNALDATVTTGNTLKAKTVAYWKLFCKIAGQVADGNESVIENPYRFNIVNLTDAQVDATPHIVNSSDVIEYNDYAYAQKGQAAYIDQYDAVQVNNFDVSTYDTYDRINFLTCYIEYVNDLINVKVLRVNVEKLTGNVRSVEQIFNSAYFTAQKIAVIIPLISLPIIIGNVNYTNVVDYITSHLTSIGMNPSNVSTPDYVNTLRNTFNSTHFGESIKNGRRAITSNGGTISSDYTDDSVPVKRSSIRTKEGEVSAQVGWDIPQDQVYDDVLDDSLPWKRVNEGIGALEIPDTEVKGYENDDTRVITDPDAEVSDPAADPDLPVPDPPTWEDILEDQGGDFYPAGMDLTELFPFCIPFDIIYLVNKMYVTPVAPDIHFKIVYPAALRSTLGEYYDVEVDFNDYVALRNVLRIFLLLMFIVGLMKITRDLIRG